MDLKPGIPAVPSNGLEQGMIARRNSKGTPIIGADKRPVGVKGKAYQARRVRSATWPRPP